MLIVPQNITAPQTITLIFKTPSLGADLSTVSSVALNVVRYDGSTTTWAARITSQTPSELVTQYTFTGSGEITTTGTYYVTGALSLPGGVVTAQSIAMFVVKSNIYPARTEESAWLATTVEIPGAAGARPNGLIFRPGLPSSPPYYATWAEIKTRIIAMAGAVVLYVDSSNAPAIVDSVTDCEERLTVFPARGPIAGTPMRLTIADGAQLNRPFLADGTLEIASATTTAPAMVLNNCGFEMRNGARLLLLAGATRPFLDIPAMTTVTMLINLNAFYSTAASGVPFARILGAGATFVHLIENIPTAQPHNDMIEGPAGSSIIYVTDSSVRVPTNAGFFGTTTKLPYSRAELQVYTPTTLSDWSGVSPTSVGDALDRIAAKITPIS